jgi:hypothetical protein
MNCIDKGLEHNPHWEDGICIRCGVDCHFEPVVFTGSAHGCHYQIRDTGIMRSLIRRLVSRPLATSRHMATRSRPSTASRGSSSEDAGGFTPGDIPKQDLRLEVGALRVVDHHEQGAP